MANWRHLGSLAALTVAGNFGCQASVDERSDTAAGATTTNPASGAGSGGSAGVGGASTTAVDSAIAQAVVRRLTRREYNSTLHELLADTSQPANAFLPDDPSLGFDNTVAAQTVSPVLAEQYLNAAEQVARVAAPALLAQLPCAASSRDTACVESFVRNFGQRAWRRPLLDAEVTRLLGVYQAESVDGGFDAGFALTLETLLVSAPFLFRIELGEPVPESPGHYRPTAFEMATRLSYLMWGSMPDAELFARAADGTLRVPAQVGAQAERLLHDARAHDTVAHFHEQWLQLSSIEPTHVAKDAIVYPEASDALLTSMRTEAELFVADAFWNQPSGLSALFTSNASFGDARLAAFYGVPGPTGATFEPVTLSASERPGLLTRAGLLSLFAHPDGTSPTKRGKFVRTRLLCQPLPPPPANVKAMLPDRLPGQTTRERVAAHKTDPTCAACHNLLDPIGLGFEQYDGLGHFRAEEAGKLVDASGSIDGADVPSPAFVGAAQLGQMLASSATVRSCVARQWFRFAYGREDVAADEAALSHLAQAFAESGGNFPKLLLDLTQMPEFLERTAPGVP